MQSLVNAHIHQHTEEKPFHAHIAETFVPKRNTKITVKRVFEKLNTVIAAAVVVVVADIGEALFGEFKIFRLNPP
jgi:hypothetical protein